MTDKQRKRRRIAIVKILSDMSREGWKNARYEDYRPLEVELQQLDGAHV